MEEGIALAKEWFAKGQCPGCSNEIRVLPYTGRHRTDGLAATAYGPLDEDLPPGVTYCRYDSDDLYSMALMATGVVGSQPSRPAPG